MKYKQLGSLKISAIALGAMPLSLSGRPPESDAISVIHKALDFGVTLIDTADAYCRDGLDKHHNESLIAKALQKYPGDTSSVIVATKGGIIRPYGRWVRDGNPERLRKTIRESYVILRGSKPIDLWQYHAPDPNYSIEESLALVKEAVTEGKIRYVGVSNFTMVARLVQDHEQIIRNLREDVDRCSEEYHDEGTADFLTELMEQHEEMAWMLRSFLEGESIEPSSNRPNSETKSTVNA
ncbi:aldo/keto reductase [Pleurocapsales cyanobacterium LEGE 10410]|nr:aldo/keto reductase [Pleurocapsales cyanobacterium LEGE 10410]